MLRTTAVSVTEKSPDSGSLVQIASRLDAGLERTLGYFGKDRFVCFYYEPRGEEVMWRDSQTYGFGTGAWFTFMSTVQPLAEQHGVTVGADGSPGRHVLVIDRVRHTAYFAHRQNAEWFFTGIAGQIMADDGEETIRQREAS